MILITIFGLLAALFASVGQAGGAGFVAVMGLFGYGPAAIKLTALTLTLVVAAIGVLHFARSGLLKTRDWYPFAVLGVPCSVLGGMITLPGAYYRPLVALLLLAAAARLLLSARGAEAADQSARAEPPLLLAILTGGVIAVIAGITGMGGGLFLAPLLLSFQWATTKRAAAITQMNNLYTAAAALAGMWITHPNLPPQLPWWALAAAASGFLGAWVGSKYLPATALRIILAAILVASGIKLALG